MKAPTSLFILISSLLLTSLTGCSAPTASKPTASPTATTPGASGNTAASPTPPASASPVQSALVSFGFIGVDADKVTTSDSVHPDGVKDGHFRVTLTLANQTEIKSFRLVGINADGSENGGQIANTNNPTYFNLAVVNSAGQTLNLNMGYPATLGKFATGADNNLTLDLYASDSGFFTADTKYRLEIILGDGSKLTKDTVIKG